MLNRVLWLLIAFPMGVLLVTLAVANRHEVRLVLNPFRPENPDIYLDAPFFAFLLAMLMLGVLIGGFAMWLSQGQWRRLSRHRGQQAVRWQAEADRLARERDASLEAAGRVGVGSKKLAVVRR